MCLCDYLFLAWEQWNVTSKWNKFSLKFVSPHEIDLFNLLTRQNSNLKYKKSSTTSSHSSNLPFHINSVCSWNCVGKSVNWTNKKKRRKREIKPMQVKMWQYSINFATTEAVVVFKQIQHELAGFRPSFYCFSSFFFSLFVKFLICFA